MKVRVLTAIVGIISVLGLVWLGGWFLTGAVFLVSLIALAEYDRAEATLDALTARWPQRETPWLLHLRMAAALRDGAAIQKTLHDIEEKEVYLSAKGRETVRFWQGKNA